MRRAASSILVLCACAASFGQFSSSERKGIADALYVGNLKVEDLGYAKRPYAGGGYGIVRDGLNKPLETSETLMGLHASAGYASVSTLLTALIAGVYDEPLLAIQHDPPMSGLDDLPDDLRRPILGLANWINSANNEIKHATERLTPEEKRALIESLPELAVADPSVRFSYVHGTVLTPEEAKSLLAKVDLARIRSAAARLAEAIERAIEQLKVAKSDFKGVIRERVGGMPIVVAGTEDDVHTDTDAVLTVDLGGNDTYKGRHGAGVGYTSVLIDMGGDDTYDVGDLNIGAGVLGIGLAYDLGGHDIFRGGSITFGAGIGGVGVLSKEGDGDDTYRAETLCEGFGSFGIGLLRDSGGTDDYEAMLYAQGSARSQGAGWLIDGAGRDMYRCGGLVDAGAKFPTAHLSCAQAYADGWSGLGGGCGLLTDLGGDDVYVCEVRGQGCALDGGVASLYDKSGNDDYSGYDEGQAFASQSSFSTLFDLDGDDTYTMKVGSCHALGTGYGVALLLDRAGDDVYMARESAPGSGVEHGLGLFVDAEGTDRYYGPPGKGVVAGGSGSLGVFVDLNGDDVYTAGLADGQSKSTPTWGVALDQASTVPTREVGRPQPVPGSDQMPDDDTMAAVFSAATQPDASAAVQDALDRLVRIGAPGLEWMLKNRLDGADSYGVQAFATVVGALGPEGSRQIGAKTFSATDAELAALIEIAVSASVKDFGAVLPGLMKKPALRAAAIAAAGDLNARAAVPELLAACRDKDAEVVRSAVASLTKIADPQSATTAQAMLLNEDFMVRKEAVALMAQFPSQALTAGTSLAGSTDEGRARTGIDVLGRVGSAEALDKIAQMLLDPRPGVRMEALMQLDGRCPEKYRLDFLSLLQDPVALVRSVAKSVSAGGQS